MRHLADSLFYRLDSLRPPLMFCLVLIGFLSVCAFVGGACLVTRFSRRTCESRKVAHHRSRLLLRSLPAAE
jgi:hypothetical protein